MKLKVHGMFLSLFFALAFCLSFSIEASAHEYTRSDGQHTYTHSEDINVSASGVGIANEAQMKLFVRHLATHLDLIQKDTSLDEMTKQEQSREIVIFATRARQVGPFNDGSDIYVIGVTPRGAITNHGLHPNLYGYRYDSSQEPLRTLLGDTVPELSDDVDPECATYDSGNRVACAVRQQTPIGTITTITGLHHGEDDYAQAPNCDEFNFAVTAKDVEDETDPVRKKELLKEYVKEVIATSTSLLARIGQEVAIELRSFDPANPDPRVAAETNARFYEKAPCFHKEPDLRYRSTYPFIMDPIRGVVFLSGTDFARNGISASLNDPNPVPYDGTNIEPNVLTAIQRTLTGITPEDKAEIDEMDIATIEHGDSGFFRYHWSHPINTELNIPGGQIALEREVVPGKALKESYIEAVDLLAGLPIAPPPGTKALFVFGSGIYLEEGDGMMPEPEMPAEDSDDGCAIAATGNTPQSMLFNLFLIASVLFSAVFLRKRV
ncbi:MAG: hypothetical protein F4X55_00120 [Candidatus Dadabacteria bacterium]|nr:hypothetical protein [Candidatus Dadabacteria bacterium]MYC39415.1 hypothetical protein [Candidatus Dadabacteria bacterium]